jgi:hypothetical protein
MFAAGNWNRLRGWIDLQGDEIGGELRLSAWKPD